MSKNGINPSRYDIGREPVTDADLTNVDLDVGPNQDTIVMERELEKGEIISLGVGSEGNQDEAVGRQYVDIVDSGGTEIDGKFAWTVRTKQRRLVGEISRYTVADCRVGETNRTDRYPFPDQRTKWLSYPYVLGLEFRTDSGTATLDPTHADFGIIADARQGERTA